MTPKERAIKVVNEYGYPELTQLQDLIERAIVATIEACARIAELNNLTDEGPYIANQIREQVKQ